MLGLGSTVAKSHVGGEDTTLNWMRIHYDADQTSDINHGIRLLYAHGTTVSNPNLAIGDTIKLTGQIYLDPTQHSGGDGWNGTDEVKWKFHFGGPNTFVYIPQEDVYNFDIEHVVSSGSPMLQYYIFISTSIDSGDRPRDGARAYIRNLRTKTIDSDGSTIHFDYSYDFTSGGSLNNPGGTGTWECNGCAGAGFTASLGTSPFA